MTFYNLTFVYFNNQIKYRHKMTRKEKYWYQKRKLKHVTAFLTLQEKAKLKRIVKQNSDLTLTRYVSRLLKNHIKDLE